MAAKSELIASGKSNEEIKTYLGCDNLVYQDLEDLIASVKDLNPNLDDVERSIFDGHYLTEISESYLNKLEEERGSKIWPPQC